MARIGVLGIGNVLMGDDALGPYVVKLLEARWDFPPEVELIEAGTPGLDLTVHVAGLDLLVVVDTVRAGGPPGTIRIFDRETLLSRSPVLPTSPHEPGLKEALLTMEFGGGLPAEVVLVGVVPASVETGLGLSGPVRDALPAVEAEVLRQVAERGHPARPRNPPGRPDVWWERSS